MAVDRSNQSLVVYKGADKVATGVMGTKSVTITGLAAGTIVSAGEYQVCFTDGTTESAKVDVPAFTVATPTPEAAANATVTPTNDGAKVAVE